MTDIKWQTARLIPTSGISGQDEAERRATSALLAVMSAVKEFGAVLTKPYGAPANWLETYIEVPFPLNGKKVIPDGLLRTSRGSKTWTALVEVKTGSATLQTEQIENYLDVAREQGFDAVITISNEISYAPGVHPTTVDRRKTKSVGLHHISWAEILTAAVQQRVYRGVADPDQAWMLGELIRYLEHPKSGAQDFDDMGEPWVDIRNSVTNATIRANNDGLHETVQRWEQLLRFVTFRLSRELGADVTGMRTRAEQSEPALRVEAQKTSLVGDGRMSGEIRIPGAVGDLGIIADVRSGRVTVYVDIDAPQEGRSATRVNWLLRQLKEAPQQLTLEAWVQGGRSSMSELLSRVREDASLLIQDSNKELKRFRVSASAPLGTSRKLGNKSFIESIVDSTSSFYEEVVQNLTPWTPKAPQLPSGGRTATEAAGIDTRPSSSDFTATELSADQKGRQGVFAPPSAPPEPRQWIVPTDAAVDDELIATKRHTS